jgi:hypothetical protein
MRIRIQLDTSMRIRILLLVKVMGFYRSRQIDPPGSVVDPDPGSGAFLTPGPGIRKGFFLIPDSEPIFLRA